MNQCITKVPNTTGIRARLLQIAALVVLLLAVLATIVFRAPIRQEPAATATSTEHARASVKRDIDVVAALDVETAMQVTPEYRVLSRYPADSPQHRILSRKARLRVTAAAQYVARNEQYGTVLGSASSGLPDITPRVLSIMETPTLDFFPVAVLSHRPFTGEEIPLAA